MKRYDMKYCLRCAREIGEGHDYCPYCGTSQKKTVARESNRNASQTTSKVPVVIGICIAIVLVFIVVAFVESFNVDKSNHAYKQHSISVQQEKSFSSPIISVSARQILNDFNNNEIRAGEQYNGKRVRITGCAASIDNTMGVLGVFINSCGGDFDIDYIHAQFPDNAKSRLSNLNKNQRVIVECSIIDGGDVMGVAAENCILK